ncbi:YCF48-related protein [Castellaniella sp. GW247-6E4]|uniref:WD40/YVTN/BNR-like repeat-containing protein n=1 Tax=Castellaniella sp. GW247-6E4 TaxID=3140380 RepID=UPI00331465FD
MQNHHFACAKIFSAMLCLLIPALGWAFDDPLETPAMMSAKAATSPMQGIAVAGSHTVAVGIRGQVVLFNSEGVASAQAEVPVSTDLLAVSFPTAEQGWAVGHGGVVIHTSDGGMNWTKQLDGQQAFALAVHHFRQTGEPAAERLFKQEESLMEDGGTPSFMGVYFKSPTSGYVVGTFNRIFRTKDGGKSWVPWMGHIDNPDELHFHAIAGNGSEVYLVGERGMVWRLDAARQRFLPIPTPYSGSLFGLAVISPESLLVFGMRGRIYRSENAGTTWDEVPSGTSAGITAGTVLSNGDILLANLAGGISLSRDGGRTFSDVQPKSPMSYYDLVALPDGHVAISGSEGVRVEIIGK